MNEWQPIETAPKWGGDYLVFCPDTREQMVCFWCDGKHVFAKSEDRVYSCSPSHWMPLPEPPDA